MIYLTMNEMHEVFRKEGFCDFKIKTYDGLTVIGYRTIIEGDYAKYTCAYTKHKGGICYTRPWYHRHDLYDEDTYYRLDKNNLRFEDWNIKYIEIPKINHTPIGDIPNEYPGKYWIIDGGEEQ